MTIFSSVQRIGFAGEIFTVDTDFLSLVPGIALIHAISFFFYFVFAVLIPVIHLKGYQNPNNYKQEFANGIFKVVSILDY